METCASRMSSKKKQKTIIYTSACQKKNAIK